MPPSARVDTPNPLDIALGLASQGYPVFPCGQKKRPAIAKKDGGHGFLDAVTDADAVLSLFGKARAHLVGVPTGEKSGFDVLDFDYRNGALEWENLHRDKLPRTRTHQTMSGGRHLVFRHTPGVRNLASNFAPGMDVRGDGGYVIMPPSNGYIVIDNAEPADWPEWLLEIILRAKPESRPIITSPPLPRDAPGLQAYIDKIIEGVRSAPDGSKHMRLRNAALSLGGLQHQSGHSDREIESLLIAALPKSVEDWEAAKDTVAWGIKNGRLRPITLEERPRLNGSTPSPSSALDRRKFDGLDTQNPITPQKLPPILVLSGYRHAAADAGLAALVAAGVPFYQRDRTLVRAATTKAKTANGQIIEVPSIVPVTIPLLSRALGMAANWERASKDGEVLRIDPPKEVVEQIFAMNGEWPFPPIAGVISTPTMRPDGTILATPGYDPATGLVLMTPPKMPPIPEEPSEGQAAEALQLLKKLLNEFPFTEPTGMSVALSMMLTVVLRGALPPAVPMHVVSAPKPGTGKSYLLDTAAAIATGERCPVIAVAPDANETEKRLVAAALAGFPIIALDNVNDLLTGDFLAQVTERPILQVRPLGGSAIARIANTFTTFANGNNIMATADMVRRTIQATLDSDLEDPENRVFTGDPVAEVLADRGKYVAACLTIARAYLVAGSPNKCPRLASFTAWSDIVRSALGWLGMPDPVVSMNVARIEDPAREARAAVFAAWADHLRCDDIGYTTSELIAEASATTDQILNFPALREAFIRVASDRSRAAISPERLGRWLRTSANIRLDRWKLTINRQDATRPRWCLQARITAT